MQDTIQLRDHPENARGRKVSGVFNCGDNSPHGQPALMLISGWEPIRTDRGLIQNCRKRLEESELTAWNEANSHRMTSSCTGTGEIHRLLQVMHLHPQVESSYFVNSW